MSQIALPLKAGRDGPQRIVIGAANIQVAEALANPESWPFRTAVLTGPPRSGKSLFASWFQQTGKGMALDDAQKLLEDEVFHCWNRAQQNGEPLLIVAGEPPWEIVLPDLKSRLGAALQLEIGTPDDELAGELLLSLAQERALPLGPEAVDYLIPRMNRSWQDIEKLVEMIDRLSLERKSPPTLGIWRSALGAVHGPEEPRLL